MKTRIGFETILLLPAIEIDGEPVVVTPDGLFDFFDIPSSVLNQFIPVTKPSQPLAAQGGNVSKVILDSRTIALNESDTDGERVVTSKGDAEELTFHNFTVELAARRDASLTADSTENLFRDLTRAPDVPYVLAHRVRGQIDYLEEAVLNQEWDFYYIHTDVQVPGYGDNENQQAQQTTIPKNVVHTGHKLTA